jgi:hypothetical protein
MNDEEQRLGIELMKTQIAPYRKQERWEIIKSIATLLTMTAAWAGIMLTIVHFSAPSPPIIIQLHLL